MEYEIRTERAAAMQFAAVRDRATFADLSEKILRHVGTVIQSLRAADIPFGRCIVLYGDHEDKTPAGFAIAVGWEVDVPFTDASAGISTIQTPAGEVASTVHIGPYSDLHKAHAAIHRWCEQQGLRRMVANWEVYDHQREGRPVRTDVYYLLG